MRADWAGARSKSSWRALGNHKGKPKVIYIFIYYINKKNIYKNLTCEHRIAGLFLCAQNESRQMNRPCAAKRFGLSRPKALSGHFQKGPLDIITQYRASKRHEQETAGPRKSFENWHPVRKHPVFGEARRPCMSPKSENAQFSAPMRRFWRVFD